MALGDSHTRRNAYDGELEFFVVLSEKAKRTEESSYEEEHRKRQKVDHDPSSDLGTNFSALDARATREAEEKKKQVETPQVTKYLQTKETLKKFLTSMMSKAGKLRHLVRDLKKSYCDSATATCLKTLETHIADVDKHYDRCNESWATGEVEDFGTEEWYKQAEQRMKDATFVCAKATAYETKIRNAKKYYEKKGPAEQDDGMDHELPKKKKESEKNPKKNKKDKKSKKDK
ncbi:unnamed protein product [Cladocopium goreaui]|uniref:Uncharacterized protein n=1 Tax=Cladocopium goreaui TaxID=2562237 RepID=A0A9P1BNL0_9DINO|nr:unnamed protein product [Cladocopium goreaui]